MSQQQKEQISEDLKRLEGSSLSETVDIYLNAINRHSDIVSNASKKANEALVILGRQRDELPEDSDERKAKEKEITDYKERLRQCGISET